MRRESNQAQRCYFIYYLLGIHAYAKHIIYTLQKFVYIIFYYIYKLYALFLFNGHTNIIIHICIVSAETNAYFSC